MVTKDLQTLNFKFDEIMFNSLVFTWERNFEATFGIFSVLVSQVNVLESYLDIYLNIYPSYGFLITKELILWLPNFGFFFTF